MNIVANVRIAEDSIAFVLLTMALVALIRTWLFMRANDNRLRFIPITLVLGLIPLYVWKGLGAIRRVFISKVESPELYASMNHIGELFEGVGGLVLAAAIMVIWYRIEAIRTISKKKRSRSA